MLRLSLHIEQNYSLEHENAYFLVIGFGLKVLFYLISVIVEFSFLEMSPFMIMFYLRVSRYEAWTPTLIPNTTIH